MNPPCSFPVERHNQLMDWLSFHEVSSDSLTAGLLTGNTQSLANSHFTHQHNIPNPSPWLNVIFIQTLH